MAVNQIVNRSAAGALIPVEYSREIIKNVAAQSTFLRLARRLPNMTAKQRKLPVLSSLAQAYFVGGDTGLKQTTTQEWSQLTIEAEEIAVVVPVPDAVLDDADYDLWAELQPELVAAIGQKIDNAVFHGLSGSTAPATWPTGIVPAAVAASNVVTLGTGLDLYTDVLGVDGVIAKVEEDGYVTNGIVGAVNLRAQMRALRSNQQPVFATAPAAETGQISPYTLAGHPVVFSENGGIDPTLALMITGDWTKAVYAIRQDITFEVFRDGVISDDDGKVVLNLMQQDASAIRVVFRMGWQRARPVNRINPNGHPFAALLPSGIGG